MEGGGCGGGGKKFCNVYDIGNNFTYEDDVILDFLS